MIASYLHFGGIAVHYRFAASILFAVLPMMHLLAAPVPDPSAILDIGPPFKGMTAEEYRKLYIDILHNMCGYDARRDPDVKKLSSVVSSKTPWLWLKENLRVVPEKDDRRLRLTFGAGSRAEQVAILNCVLRIYMERQTNSRKGLEKKLQLIEESLPRLKKKAETEVNPIQRARYQQDLESAPSVIAEVRANIARYKEISVIKWAR
jgi:hypothetical protein